VRWEWDVFISYPRGGEVAEWVEEFLLRRLTAKLTDAWDTGRPRIFLDRSALGPGDALNATLTAHLRAARVLVPVLTPSYLKRPYCMAELTTFLEREIAGGPSAIVPILARGDDRDARQAVGDRLYEDMTRLVYVGGAFERSPRFLELQDAAERLTHQISKALKGSPDQPDPAWPTVDMPEVPPERRVTPDIPMPRLGR
jgi:hypothetical protein